MLTLEKKLITLLLSLMLFAGTVYAQEFKASLAQMPNYAESMEKGVLVDLVKAMSKESGVKISYSVVPFARSMDNVITKKVDFHMPLIVATNLDESKLKYDHSTETIFHVNFILYTNKSKPIKKEDLKTAKVETDMAHTQYFDFPVVASTNIAGSLRKLNAGVIDAFIFADFASDPIVKGENLSNIKRELYYRFDVKIILPKGANGGEIDKFLTKTIKAMRAKGTFQTIMDPIDTPYDNWQP